MYSICGMERLSSCYPRSVLLPVGYEYCNLCILSSNTLICGPKWVVEEDVCIEVVDVAHIHYSKEVELNMKLVSII